MPIYDYSCTVCRHLVEVVHRIDDPGPRFCPSCGAEGSMRKGFTTPAVHFKGSGWAKKDRSTTSSASKSSKPADASSGAEKSATSSETSARSSETSAPSSETAQASPATPAASHGPDREG